MKLKLQCAAVFVLILLTACENTEQRKLTGTYIGTKLDYYINNGTVIRDETTTATVQVSKKKDDILILKYTIPYTEIKEDGTHTFPSPFNQESCTVTFTGDSLICRFYSNYNQAAQSYLEYRLEKFKDE